MTRMHATLQAIGRLELAQLKHQLRAVSVTVRRYLVSLAWLTRDVLARYKRDCVLIIGTGTGGIALQGTMFGLAIVFAGKVQAGESIGMLGYELSARSAEMLSAVAVAILGSLALAALLIYYSHRKMIKLAFDYEFYCAERVYTAPGARFIDLGGQRAPPEDAAVLRLTNSDGGALNRMVRVLVQAPVHLFTFLAATAVLFSVSAFLTLLILPFILVAGVLLYRLNIGTAAATREFEKIHLTASREMRGLFQMLKDSDAELPSAGGFVSDAYRSGFVARRFDVNLRRMLAPLRSQLIVNALLAVCLAVIIQYFGIRALTGGLEEWGALLGYLVALRFALVALRTVATQFTSINRFYPNLRRYYDFITASRAESDGASPCAEITLSPVRAPQDGDLDRWRVGPGGVLGVYSAVELNRYTAAFVVESLAMSSDRSAAELFASSAYVIARKAQVEDVPPPVRRAHAQHTHRTAWSLARARKLLEPVGIWDSVAASLPADLQQHIEPIDFLRIPDLPELVLRVARAVENGARFVLLDEAAMRLLIAGEMQGAIRELLSDRVLVPCYAPGTHAVGQFDEDAVAILGPEGVVALLPPDVTRERFLQHRAVVRPEDAGADRAEVDEEEEGYL